MRHASIEQYRFRALPCPPEVEVLREFEPGDFVMYMVPKMPTMVRWLIGEQKYTLPELWKHLLL